MQKLGVIAGGGAIPARLLAACDQVGIEIFVVGFDGQTDRRLMVGRNHIFTRLGAAGQIINTLKSHGIRDLVLIGSIRRPTLSELRPDMRTLKFFMRLGMRALGDDGLLAALRHELQGEGFTIHGVQQFAGDLLAGEGPMGRHKPKRGDRDSVIRALIVARELGRLDVGQAVVVQQGIILGVEGIEGTDELIRRCSAYKREGRGPILVKICKPGQDPDLDLPTIGPETVISAAEAGMAGIVVHAGQSLMLEPDKVTELADRSNLFVVGINPDYPGSYDW